MESEGSPKRARVQAETEASPPALNADATGKEGVVKAAYSSALRAAFPGVSMDIVTIEVRRASEPCEQRRAYPLLELENNNKAMVISGLDWDTYRRIFGDDTTAHLIFSQDTHECLAYPRADVSFLCSERWRPDFNGRNFSAPVDDAFTLAFAGLTWGQGLYVLYDWTSRQPGERWIFDAFVRDYSRRVAWAAERSIKLALIINHPDVIPLALPDDEDASDDPSAVARFRGERFAWFCDIARALSDANIAFSVCTAPEDPGITFAYQERTLSILSRADYPETPLVLRDAAASSIDGIVEAYWHAVHVKPDTLPPVWRDFCYETFCKNLDEGVMPSCDYIKEIRGVASYDVSTHTVVIYNNSASRRETEALLRARTPTLRILFGVSPPP